MIRAVGANRANDRISFVREGIDSLPVTNRTPIADDFYRDQQFQAFSVSGRYTKHTGFACALTNDSSKCCCPVTPVRTFGGQARAIQVA
jgi:hypothetical protein